MDYQTLEGNGVALVRRAHICKVCTVTFSGHFQCG